MVEVVDKNKTAAGVSAIAGLAGRQRSVKLREISSSPSTTRSKSVIVRGQSTGSEESVKGTRRRFSLMHNSLEA